jgi:FtsH-binding integral membrane protein
MNYDRNNQQQQPQDPYGAMAAGAADQYGYIRAASSLAVDARMAFLRKVYGWFMVAVLISAASAAGVFLFLNANQNILVSLTSGFTWLFVIGGYMVLGIVFQKLLLKRETALLGLIGYGVIQGFFLGVISLIAFHVAGQSFDIVGQGIVLTVIVFGGLTGYVFLTRQDFSFMRGALVIGSFVLLGIIVMGVLFGGFGGNTLGLAIAGFGILLMAGWVLYDTSNIVHKFGEGDEMFAAVQLHISFTTMLYYVILFLIQLTSQE